MTILVSKILAAMATVALLMGGVVALTVQDLSLGSVDVSSEYTATSTAEAATYGAGITATAQVKTTGGTLGSVVVTGAATGIVNLYDATTSDATLRASSKATSTLLLVSLPASLAAGTYTFDVRFRDGLLLDLESGVMPTTTITFRN